MYSQYKLQDETGLLRETASQTSGPFVHIGLALEIAGFEARADEIWQDLASDDAEGEHIELVGYVYDGNGDLVRDALIEIWQADSQGDYLTDFDNKKPFRSFGRSACALDGEFHFNTVKPGQVDFDGKTMAPHVNIAVFARGINLHLQTRAYFNDEQESNKNCPILTGVPSPERRKTLIAVKEEGEGKPRYRFDICLQGDSETVFFDF
ncbi:protocatechuate 3,4-dioxygenase subunit alpha [Psychrobacter sp. LV10R520-6]|uniref:protocatechuate 3,4-dioxygenase subunit alpha n=1 Tax=Psychrobacter sp. LV10R520-6 TaxID=1415574 RepID=UPI0024C841EB|nr:protocatechuate 3,4-dioxygenase subunit alpha [Psychrobacter sp. LV10R520-6]SNT70464.1 protocatechuate 3,4-dioxygenase, alpha subunit [Psychrobacter sp. LV10R520-6]